VPENRKKGFYTSRISKNEEIGGIFVISGSQNFKLFSKIQDQIKNKKPIVVDVLGVSNGTTLMQI
jgi:hypothetical protein